MKGEFDVMKRGNGNEDIGDLWEGGMSELKEFGMKGVDDMGEIFEWNEGRYKLVWL
ncbi:hypothetical protein [Bacillus pumilus]|uniref:hypothetical protein n=1 Tax=Bacillus pumilus TaxID=1408 RepID=UPI0016429C8A|nr:hypothetical protein [Bacillus pumilus]